jgi:hypothetical protein
VALALCLLGAPHAEAVNHLIAVDEVLGSWRGDDDIQFVELRLLAGGQTGLANGGGASLVFDDATGSGAGRRTFRFELPNPGNGLAGARVLVATPRLAALTGITPDYLLPAGLLVPRDGRVCYVVNPPQDPFQTTGIIDCVAYGKFVGIDGRFGPPTPFNPDGHSLQRVAETGQTIDDWAPDLTPTPQSNTGEGLELPTLCGDGIIEQGEDCDGALLGGQTCATLGFARGVLACALCHFDPSACSSCGNGAVNGREQCDGADLGGRTCASLGFTGGALGCTDRCRITTLPCDPTFFVPGDGPVGPECLAAWRMTNASQRPGADGRAPVRQRCRDGDSGCDADALAGTCTFTVAVCFGRDDPRLSRGTRPCRRPPVDSWTLVRPALGATGAQGQVAATLVAGMATLGSTTTAGSTVTFAPPLASGDQCTAPLALVLPAARGKAGTVTLRTRTAAGRLRDLDTLRLVCTP